MKGFKLSNMAAVLAVFGGMMAGTSAYAMKSHDNELVFSVSNLKSCGYWMTAYNITGGQPFQAPVALLTNGSCTISIEAGRESESAPATWFADQIKPGAAIGDATKSSLPSTLNFAVTGSFTINVNGETITCPVVVLGQGNSFTTNNWWVGGPQMTRSNNSHGIPQLSTKCNGVAVTITQGGNANSFSITLN